MNDQNQKIAWYCLILSAVLMSLLFIASRNDPSLRIAALVAGTGLVSSLSSIASTMLTGKDVTKRTDPSDVPPNTTIRDTTSTTVVKGDS